MKSACGGLKQGGYPEISGINKILLILFAISCSLLTVKAQWQSDVRLTNDPASSETSSINSGWSIAANSDVVHVVWFDYRDGNYEVYYKRSTDGGINWGTDIRLTNAPNDSWYPAVSVSGQVVHVVWMDRRDGNYEIYYKRSTDGGISWGADARLTNNPAISNVPSVAVSGQVVHVVWPDSRNGGNPEMYYKRSTDGGASWETDTRLTINSYTSTGVSVSVSGSVVHVVWMDRRNGNYQIFYKRSTNEGVNWGADTQVTNSPVHYVWPSVAVSGQVVHIVWYDNALGHIFYKRSADGGISWEADTQLTNGLGYSRFPNISVSGSVVHVVWQDTRDGNTEIYYKRSTNGGVSWESDTRLTNDPAISFNTSAAVSGSVVHVVWEDNRDGNAEIYYKRDPIGNPLGIININSETPSQFSLSQNYPNPFNPVTKIKFQIRNSKSETNSKTEIRIYDVLGKEIVSLVNEELSAGTYEVTWDASDYPSGVYLYKLTSALYSETKKMILLK